MNVHTRTKIIIIFKTVLGWLLYHLTPRKSIVYILSTMRSGSTLLKALLANAEDVSHLPEVKLIRYDIETYYSLYFNLYRLSKKRIIVVKYPAWYTYENYPHVSLKKNHIIVLIRKAFDTLCSLKDRQNVREFTLRGTPLTDQQLIDYWCQTYESLLFDAALTKNNHIFQVRYEQLLEEPRAITRSLFAFIGSQQKEGVISYPKPRQSQWQWGQDDASANIKTQQVQKSSTVYKPSDYPDLHRLIQQSARVKAIEQELLKDDTGYFKK